MERRELRSFCTAARLRSITKAAEYREIGQPMGKNQRKKIEEEAVETYTETYEAQMINFILIRYKI